MNQGPLIFLGLLVTMALSWSGMILTPQLQIGRQAPEVQEELGDIYPKDRPGLALQGADVYRSLGCAVCHTRQVRGGFPDIPRYGQRITVAADYLFDAPVQLGAQRVGPDLANVGLRLPDAAWHWQHLYNPQIHAKGSVMPPYRFLFVTRKVGATPAPDALVFPAGFAPKAGYEVVPTDAARALVAYLQSLRVETPLFEAPMSAPTK